MCRCQRRRTNPPEAWARFFKRSVENGRETGQNATALFEAELARQTHTHMQGGTKTRDIVETAELKKKKKSIRNRICSYKQVQRSAPTISLAWSSLPKICTRFAIVILPEPSTSKYWKALRTLSSRMKTLRSIVAARNSCVVKSGDGREWASRERDRGGK